MQVRGIRGIYHWPHIALVIQMMGRENYRRIVRPEILTIGHIVDLKVRQPIAESEAGPDLLF